MDIEKTDIYFCDIVMEPGSFHVDGEGFFLSFSSFLFSFFLFFFLPFFLPSFFSSPSFAYKIRVCLLGTLITTKECLLHPSRNPNLTQSQIGEKLKVSSSTSCLIILDFFKMVFLCYFILFLILCSILFHRH